MNLDCDNGDENIRKFNSGRNHPFQILYRAVERYKKESRNGGSDPLGQDALLLYCWGLVHGISIIITRGEFSYQGDYMELVKRILWDEAFLK
jgi:hypothetical protein